MSATNDVFVGRQPDLSLLRSRVDAALAGRGFLVLMAGEAGIGKTRLAEELALGADLGDARTVWSSCWEGTASPAFWPWVHLLRQCSDVGGGGGGSAELRALLEGTTDGVTGRPDDLVDRLRVRLFEDVAELLHEAARFDPILLVIDDLHLADSSSLRLLQHLAGRLRQGPVALLATYRDPGLPPSSPLADCLGAMVRIGKVHQVTPLDDDDAAQLARATTSVELTATAVSTILDRSGGNPLFIAELARLVAVHHARAAGDADWTSPIPETVRQVLSERLSYVSGACLELLGDAAVCGEAFDTTVLQRIAGVDADALAELVDEATKASLIQREASGHNQLAFTHALVRDVLYAGIPGPARRELHRRVAEALADRTTDPPLAEIAYHLGRATPDVDIAVVLNYTRRAALQSLAVAAFEEAAAQFTHGLELTDDDGTRVEFLLGLGEARMRGGDWPSAINAYEQAAQLARRRGNADELARAALGMGAGLGGFEVRLFDRRQLDLLREALATVDAADSRLRAWLQARLSVAASFVEPVERRIELSQDAVASATHVGDPSLHGYALASYCDAIAGPAHSEERLAIGAEIIGLGEMGANPEVELLGRRLRVVAALELGDTALFDREVSAFDRAAGPLRQPLYAWLPPMWRAMRALLAGRIAESEQQCEQAREIGERAGSVNAAIVGDVQEIHRHFESGRFDDVLRLLSPFIDDPEGGPNAEAWLVFALALVGRRAEAQAILDRLAAADFPLVVDGAWLEVIGGLAEGCFTLGDAGAAAKLTAVIEPFADRFATGATGVFCMGSLRRHLGLLAHCQGLLDDADAHFRLALEAHRRAGAALPVAHTLRQHASVLVDRDRPGDRDEAGVMLATAAAAYAEFGLDHWMTTAPRLDAEPAPPKPVDSQIFLREKDVWLIAYGATEARVRHVKGMTVIARLLASPGREIHVLDLTGAAPSRLDRDPHDASAPPGSAGDLLDATARAQYRQRLKDLEEEITDAEGAADLERASRARVERDFITDELTSALRLHGRPRQASDPAERARWTITKQIQSAIDRIGQAHPPLGQHLRNTVRTGRYCSYQPERPTQWHV